MWGYLDHMTPETPPPYPKTITTITTPSHHHHHYTTHFCFLVFISKNSSAELIEKKNLHKNKIFT
jgi:hypothetical protein